ncbi:MAG TPA: kelch repeat-containing protein, partial [Gemmatimonadales bacterium]|nr:kelch repeat-containing protein [Gemmatimonadales bacterium]
AYDPLANRVTSKADMPRHTADGVTGVIAGKLYVLAGTCGYDCTVRGIRRLYRYDPGTNVWTTLAPCPRFHINGAGAAINGKFYVAGGLAPYIGPTADLDVYDPGTNTWTALAPMPQARAHAAGARMNSKLYVVGGLGRDAYTGGQCEQAGTCARQNVYAYNPLTNMWSTKAPMPTARFGLAAAAVANSQSHILAVGGGRQSGAAGPSANELYTP